MPQEFYAGSLISAIAVISISVLISTHLIGSKNNSPRALRSFQLYFVGGFAGWLFFGLIELANLSISLSWLAIAYFSGASLLLFILTDEVKVNVGSALWVCSHLIFIILEVVSESLEVQLKIFTVYVLIHMSILSYVGFKCHKHSQNIGHKIIVLAVLIPMILGFIQVYYLYYEPDVDTVIGLGITGAATSYSLVALGFMTMMLIRERDSFAAQAHKDPLTELYNRRGLDVALEYLVAASQREPTQISAIVCDIDYFKKINDSYGHDIGDLVLKAFAEILKTLPRASDLAARLGGEEFVLVLPKTDLNEADQIAERLRKEVENMEVTITNDIVKLTASFGVACQHQGYNIDSLIKASDQALYEAKSSGRNRVCIAETEYS